MQRAFDKRPAPLQDCSIKIKPSTQCTNVDSAIDMTFPESVEKDLAMFEDPNNQSKMHSHKTNSTSVNYSINAAASSGPISSSSPPETPRTPICVVNGMPYTFERLMEMGTALAEARREKRFPPTITPGYDVRATIDDYEDLERLNVICEGVPDTKDHPFHPEIGPFYVKIQRRIQDRDLTHGEIAADSNVHARLSGFANSTGAETGMYNLMRHAMNSVLRLNNLTLDGDSNIVDAAASRVVEDIRATVKSQVARGAHGVDGVNMPAVLEQVFNNIETTLSQGVGTQANRLDGQFNRVDSQINNMSSITNAITNAHNAQVSAIAGHVNAIDNHVHAMGNNVNAMSSLVNSTNGNVTALTTNIGSLQTIVNMIPQMASDAVRDMLQDIVPGIIGPAVEQAFEQAISNELVARLQVFTNAVREGRARAEAVNNTRYQTAEKPKRGGWFNIFKKRSSHHGRRADSTY